MKYFLVLILFTTTSWGSSRTFEFVTRDGFQHSITFSLGDEVACSAETIRWTRAGQHSVVSYVTASPCVEQVVNSILGALWVEYMSTEAAGNMGARLRSFEWVDFVTAFVTNIPYRKDFFDEERWWTPYHTVQNGYGDCEDHSFLLAALLRQSGIQTAVLDFPGHMATGSTIGSRADNAFRFGKYYPCETTARGYSCGDRSKAMTTLENVFEIPPYYRD